MLNFLSKIFNTNQKVVDRYLTIVEKINQLEKTFRDIKPNSIIEKTKEFKKRHQKGESLDDLLPEAFALVREVAGRAITERHYDVQLIAAIALHEGKVAEQKTGEGKTLSAVPALYLNALTGKGVHLVTVNDYLARRDAGWMGAIFQVLGLSTGAIIHDQSFIYDPEFSDENAQDWRLRHLRAISRKEAYQADVTYGINSEFGFDYLRDNMASDKSQVVQREFHYAVVDEVDSVLIDEARTPHIISAPDMEPTKKYYEFAKMIDRLTAKIDYEIDEKLRTAALTENGILKVEKLLGIENLYEKDFQTIHHIEAALKAKSLFQIDRDYVVKDNQVVIVDEFTGRLLQGRRFSEGLHQAIEAKEQVTIQQESKTLATVSLQNYFRMYSKLAGMTGTAATEAEEFHKIYKLEVVIVPTHKPMIRQDNPDLIYKTLRAKYAAVAREVEEKYKAGQPVLVGTTSIEHNEIVSKLLKHKNIPHEVLNAKNHEREALIISKAGEKKAITVATNMAGRGVDIILGGQPPNQYTISDKKLFDKQYSIWKDKHQKVIELGGLHVIGTERHESRRIDNQLRGRSGRQGDPGSTRLFVSLEDDLMRIFGGEQIANMMTRFNIPEDQSLSHPIVSRAIEQAQIKVEGFHFDTRKHLVEYDDVLNKHREIIYSMRRKVIDTDSNNQNSLKSQILSKIRQDIENTVELYSTSGFTPQEKENIVNSFAGILPLDDSTRHSLLQKLQSYRDSDPIIKFFIDLIDQEYEKKEIEAGAPIMRQIERFIFLSVTDQLWMDHLTAIDDLREGIGLRGYGQRDPLVEYKNEAFSMFERLILEVDAGIIRRIFRVQVQLSPSTVVKPEVAIKPAASMIPSKATRTAGGIPVKSQSILPVSPQKPAIKIGRNDPCPCGSGKKYKKCHFPQYG